jgi:hypothetical protein
MRNHDTAAASATTAAAPCPSPDIDVDIDDVANGIMQGARPLRRPCHMAYELTMDRRHHAIDSSTVK